MIWCSHNFVTKEPQPTSLLSNYHSYQHHSNTLAATHLKITAKWKPLWYDGSQHRTQTSINRGYRSSYHKINSRTAVGTMWRSGGIALLLNMNCSFLNSVWTELQWSHVILISIAKNVCATNWNFVHNVRLTGLHSCPSAPCSSPCIYFES